MKNPKFETRNTKQILDPNIKEINTTQIRHCEALDTAGRVNEAIYLTPPRLARKASRQTWQAGCRGRCHSPACRLPTGRQGRQARKDEQLFRL